ncbi:MAG TPA: hypothetical protein VKB35_12875 [Ktedonobacteraceae bacterium]|nr:hypothetical protein [Ktedonobacteraceae bacterium]
MPEEHTPPLISHEILLPEQAAKLLQRQKMLQDEAQAVLKELDLVGLLSAAGILRHVGSSVLGLMTWRDLDLTVSSPGLNIERAYKIMHPLCIHPRVKQVRYFNESGSFNPTGLQLHERYYFAVLYDTPAGDGWKIDISFWLAEGIHPEPVHDALEQQLTPETRLAILWIKDTWYRLPAYRNEVYSTDMYDAERSVP